MSHRLFPFILRHLFPSQRKKNRSTKITFFANNVCDSVAKPFQLCIFRQKAVGTDFPALWRVKFLLPSTSVCSRGSLCDSGENHTDRNHDNICGDNR